MARKREPRRLERLEDADVVVRTLYGRSGWQGPKPTRASTDLALASLKAAAGTRVQVDAAPPGARHDVL